MNKKVSRLYKMYQDAYNVHQTKFDDYIEMAAYYELEQDKIKSTSVKPWVYQINTPFATDAINIRVASLQANDYTGELEPLSPEDVDNVSNLNDIYKEIWMDMNLDKKIDEAILQAAVLGEAYVHTVFDADVIKGGTNRRIQGALQSYFLDAASVHLDPKALSFKDCEYIAITERITRDEVERTYPEFNLSDLESGKTPAERGELFFGVYDTEQDKDVFTKITIYEKNKGGTIDKTVLIENKILDNTIDMEINVFPIAQLVWQKKLKSPYGTSLMNMLLPLQKVVNEIESANANANMQYSSPSYLVSEDSGIDPAEFAASSGAPGVVYYVNSGMELNRAVAPLMTDRSIDNGLVVTKQELERTIYKLAGVTDVFQGALGTAGNTSTGADMTIQRAKTIEERILTNIEVFVEALSRIIVQLISIGYAGEKLYSKGERTAEGSWEFEEFDVPEESKDIQYNFYIELNVKTKYSKEQQKRILMEMWQQERQYDDNSVKALNTLDLLKVMNIPQSRDIVERYNASVKLDDDQKAELIMEILTVSEQLQIDPELTKAAIAEVISGVNDGEVLNEFLGMAEQIRSTNEQNEIKAQEEEAAQQEQQMQEEQAVMDQMMDNQEINAMGAAPEEEDIDNMSFDVG